MPMRRFLILTIALLAAYDMYAAINAQYTFEDGVPAFLSVNGNGTLESSDVKFKDGHKSVKFSWDSPSELVFNNFSDIETSLKVNESGIMMWVYNTSPMADPIVFTILDWSMNEICHFDFYADFTGWRAIWIKYEDMFLSDGATLVSSIPLAQRDTEVSRMTVTVPSSATEGKIYIDRLSFYQQKKGKHVCLVFPLPLFV